MPHLLYQNPDTDVSRLEWVDEENEYMERRSVSVGMRVEASASSAPAGSSYGLALFNNDEDPDVYNNNSKKIRILAPTASGSGDKLQVLIDTTVVAEVACPTLPDSVISTAYFAFWQDIEGYRADYYLNKILVATVVVPRDKISSTLLFHVGVALCGNNSVKINSITYGEKTEINRVIRLTGEDSYYFEKGTPKVKLLGRGSIGTTETYTEVEAADLYNMRPTDTVVCFSWDKKDIFGKITDSAVIGDKIIVVGDTSDDYNFQGNVAVLNLDHTLSYHNPNMKLNAAVFWNNKLVLTPEVAGGIYVPGKIYTSSDGVTGTELVVPVTLTGYIKLYEKDGTLFVLGNNYILSTSDGLIWNQHAYSGAPGWRLILTPQMGMACGPGSPVLYTTDFVTWVSSGNTVTQTQANEMCGGNGIFLYMTNGTNIVYTINGGVSWLTASAPETVRNRLFSFGNGIFAARTTDNSRQYLYGAHPTELTLRKLTMHEGYPDRGEYSPIFSKYGNFFYTENKLTYDMETFYDFRQLDEYGQPLDLTMFSVINSDPLVFVSTLQEYAVPVAFGKRTIFGTANEPATPGEACSVTYNGETHTFPLNKTDTDILPESFEIANIGNWDSIDYDAPDGTFLELYYLDHRDKFEPIGEFRGTECVGFDSVEKYTNGNQDTYSVVVGKNLQSCGYDVSVKRTVVLSEGFGIITIPKGNFTILVSLARAPATARVTTTAAEETPVTFDKIIIEEIGNYKVRSYAKLGDMHLVLCDDTSGYGVLYFSSDFRKWTAFNLGSFNYVGSKKLVTEYGKVYINEVGSDQCAVITGPNLGVITYYQSGIFYEIERSPWVEGTTFGACYAVGSSLKTATTPDGDAATLTGTDTEFRPEGMFFNVDTFILHGGSTAVGIRKHVLTTEDFVTFTNVTISNLPSTFDVLDVNYSELSKLVHGNGIFLGAFSYKNSATKNKLFKHAVRGTTITSLEYFEIAELEGCFDLTFFEGYFYGLKSDGVVASVDGENWVTIELPEGIPYLDNSPSSIVNGKLLVSIPGGGLCYLGSARTGDTIVQYLPVEGGSTIISVGTNSVVAPGYKDSVSTHQRIRKYISVNSAIENKLYYYAPDESNIEVRYFDTATAHTVAHTPLTTYCSGQNLFMKYADGMGGQYLNILKENDTTTCGYPLDPNKIDLLITARVEILATVPSVIGVTIIGDIDVPVDCSFEIINENTYNTAAITFTIDTGAGPVAISNNGVFTLPAHVTDLTITATTPAYYPADVGGGVTIRIIPITNLDRVAFGPTYSSIVLGYFQN